MNAGSAAIRWTSGSTVASTLLVAAAAACGLSRNFGVFLFGGMAIATLLLTMSALLLADLAARRWRPILTSAALILFAWHSWVTASASKDRLWFAGWALLHHDRLVRAIERDGVIEHWDSWGFASNGNDSYLVADTRDTLAQPGMAERWRHRLRLPCELLNPQRMRKRVYLVITYNCTKGN